MKVVNQGLQVTVEWRDAGGLHEPVDADQGLRALHKAKVQGNL